jgi:dTDP-4-dehydrorhamnose 3,5-epimerase
MRNEVRFPSRFHNEGVRIIHRIRNPDDRGFVTEIIRNDEEHFQHFGQAYIATCYEGVVKAWHRHEHQWDTFYCVQGTMKVGLHVPRYDEYETWVLGEKGIDATITIPPGVWHGMMAIGGYATMLNLPTHKYNAGDPDEERKPWDYFDDIWTVENR